MRLQDRADVCALHRTERGFPLTEKRGLRTPQQELHLWRLPAVDWDAFTGPYGRRTTAIYVDFLEEVDAPGYQVAVRA